VLAILNQLCAGSNQPVQGHVPAVPQIDRLCRQARVSLGSGIYPETAGLVIIYRYDKTGSTMINSNTRMAGMRPVNSIAHTFVYTILLGMQVPTCAVAQSQVPMQVDPASELEQAQTVAYSASFFARYNPATALDMVKPPVIS
jgi:hypothetical protein